MIAISPMNRAQIRDVDRIANSEFEVPGIILMENAGRGCVDLLRNERPSGPISVCIGKGNNGGDGSVIARHLDNLNLDVRVTLFTRPDELTGDAAINFQILRHAGLKITIADTEPASKALFRESEWIVDALLGTGTQGEIRPYFASVIEAINESGAKVLSVDIPSGLDCDRGEALGCCVRADLTPTFVAPKLGFSNPQSRQFTGKVHVVDIGVPKAVVSKVFKSRE